MITTLPLPEAFIVLSCSWREAVLSCPPPQRALKTAILTELELRGRIHSSAAGKGSVRVEVEIIDQSPTGDTVFDRSLAAVIAAANGTTVSEGRIRLDRSIGQALANRVVEQGWFAETGRKGLVRRRPEYRVANPHGVMEMKQSLLVLLSSDDQLERRDRALISLLAAGETAMVPLFRLFVSETELFSETKPVRRARRDRRAMDREVRDRQVREAHYQEVVHRARELVPEFPFALSLYDLNKWHDMPSQGD